MTKRLLAALLAVVMVVSMMVFPTYAQEEAAPATEPGYCQHCKQVIPEEQWLIWDPKSTGPRTGHYYLAEDIPDQTAQININLDDDLMRNVICLDLRGRTYTVTGLRPFLIYGIFSIMDSVGGGEFTVTGASNAHGAFAMMGKNANSKDGSGELNIYSGTLRRVVTTTDLVSYGGLIYLSNGATLNVHGGKLIGGDVVPHLVSKTNYAPLGGTIYCTASTVNVYGGTITGGVSRSGKLLKVGSTTEYQNFEGSGGNIYLEKSSVLNISGGVIENGYADVRGGNISSNSSIVNITGGVIRGGATVGASGNLDFGIGGAFNMSGGYITGGTCRTRGGNIFVNTTSIDLNISGGTIDGDMSVGLFKSFTLSGAPKILMGNGNGLRLQRATDANRIYDKVIDISGLTEGAEIYLDGNRHDPVFTTVLENPEAYLGYFKDAVRADISVDESGALKVEQGNTGYCPHCWESGAEATWTAFDNSKPSTNITVTSQHAYLTGTTNRTRLLTISADVDYVIDTSGCALTVTGYKFANLYGTLSIMDSVGSGYITGTGHPIANGGVIMGTATGVFNMYSGTLSRTVKSGEEDKTVLDGGILHAPAGSVTNIYGGIIRDGIAAKSYKSSPIEPCGGNIYSAGTFNMEGGVLCGGKAKSTNGHINDSNGTVINTDKTYLGRGGNLYASGTATISGGHIIGGSAGYGGNVYTTTNLAITGGVIRDGVVNDDLNANDWGGNIYYTGVTNATIENAIIRGGKTPNLGGNISLYNSTLTITDSYIADGIAGIDGSTGRGGNIYVNAASKLYLNNSVVANGWAYQYGGNIRTDRGAFVQMNGGLISGGTSETQFGGSLYVNAFHMIGGRVVGGTAKVHVAGNIYVPAAADDYLIVEPAADGTPAVIANGTAGKMGGNIFVDKNASATFTGAMICNGTGDTLNTNSATNYHNIYTESATKVTLTDCTINGIKADAIYGNGIIAYGELTLKGETNIINEEKKSCAFIGTAGTLIVDESFSGKAVVAFQDVHLANVTEPQGTALTEKHTATGVFSGELLLDGFNGRDYGLPAIFAEAGDSRLHVASVVAVDPALDTLTWYKDIDAAAANTADSAYLKLYKSENTLEIAKDIAIDLNGNNLNVTGSGLVYGFDSKNDTYETYGNMTVGEGVEYTSMHTAPSGNRYIAVETENGVSFHRLGLAVTGVSLRPATSGIYYKATWECDALLQEKIESYGVAVSTVDMPGADFAEDADTLYTTLAKENFESGKSANSVLVENILASGEDNQTRGITPVYAAPYAVIDGMVVIGDDNAPTMGGAIYSLKTVLQGINRIWPKLTESQQQGIRELYALDAAVLDTWNLYNITAAINGTAAVRPLKVLTLGHSLAVDSGHMLNLVADAEGFDQPMEIATLYYSGCPLYKHVNYIKENAGVYQLYVSSTTTPDKPPVIIKGVNMKYAIEYMDWDVIVMQGGVFEIAEDITYQDGKIQFIQDYVNQHKTNPNAVFAWHMPWALPTDNTLRDMYPYSPNTYYTSYVKYNDDRTTLYNAITGAVERNIVTDDSFIYLIASGTAIENALSSYLEEPDLHRDYAHVTDLGRVISSYTWYCTLAGIDHLDEIKLDVIPAQFFKSTTGTADRILTDMEKAIILESVNNTLANPLQMTQSQYTVAP